MAEDAPESLIPESRRARNDRHRTRRECRRVPPVVPSQSHFVPLGRSDRLFGSAGNDAACVCSHVHATGAGGQSGIETRLQRLPQQRELVSSRLPQAAGAETPSLWPRDSCGEPIAAKLSASCAARAVRLPSPPARCQGSARQQRQRLRWRPASRPVRPCRIWTS